MGERAVYYIGVSRAKPNQALARATEQTMPERCHAPNTTPLSEKALSATLASYLVHPTRLPSNSLNGLNGLNGLSRGGGGSVGSGGS